MKNKKTRIKKTITSKTSAFHANLQEFFVKKIDAHKLAYNKLFLDTHFYQEQDPNHPTDYALHRCRQWLSDLHSEKRKQTLLIEDLEVASQFTGLSIEVLLGCHNDETEELVFIDDDFINLLSHMQKQEKYHELLSKLFLPIRYDPVSHTMLAVVGYSSMRESEKIKCSLEDLLSYDKETMRIAYVVYTLHSVSTLKQASNSKISPFLYESERFDNAMREYIFYKNAEKGTNLDKGLSFYLKVLTRKIAEDFGTNEKELGTIVKYQKLFNRYFDDIFDPDFIASVPDHKPLELQIALNSLK